MTPRALFGILSLAIPMACGGNAAGGPDNGGLGGANTGLASGGASLGGTSSGGESGNSLGGASSSVGGASDLSSCPPWPGEKLMPLVGVFFYGPDPGPCSSTEYEESNPTEESMTTTYDYDANGHLLSITGPTGFSEVTTTCTWTGNSLTGCTIGAFDEQEAVPSAYSLREGALVVSTSTSTYSYIETYTLTSNGYPVAYRRTDASGVASDEGEYLYENCRLTKRTALNPATGEARFGRSMTYVYDSAGRTSKRISDAGYVTEFDYSCWSD